jgi:hypothetical protein
LLRFISNIVVSFLGAIAALLCDSAVNKTAAETQETLRTSDIISAFQRDLWPIHAVKD